MHPIVPCRGGVARGMVRQGKRDGVPGQDQLAEAMVPFSAEEGHYYPAIFQVYL